MNFSQLLKATKCACCSFPMWMRKLKRKRMKLVRTICAPYSGSFVWGTDQNKSLFTENLPSSVDLKPCSYSRIFKLVALWSVMRTNGICIRYIKIVRHGMTRLPIFECMQMRCESLDFWSVGLSASVLIHFHNIGKRAAWTTWRTCVFYRGKKVTQLWNDMRLRNEMYIFFILRRNTIPRTSVIFFPNTLHNPVTLRQNTAKLQTLNAPWQMPCDRQVWLNYSIG